MHGVAMDKWTPVIGQTLLVKREPTNHKDKNAVALYEDDCIVGHVPFNLAPYLSRFLARDVNKAFAEVTGEKVNRKAGYEVLRSTCDRDSTTTIYSIRLRPA